MKYYFKKNTVAILISIFLLLISTILTVVINNEGYSDSDLYITEYKINLRINKDGSGSFDNYITYDLSNVDYVAIYEDISDKKGNIFSYGDINNNEVIYKENKPEDKSEFNYSSFETKAYQNGREISLTQIGYSFNNDIEMDTLDFVRAPYSDQERIFCYLEDGYEEDTTFNFKYEINGMVSKYLDIGIINWILSPETDISIKNLSVNISFEEKLSSSDVEHLKNNFYLHGNIRTKEEIKIDSSGVHFEVKKQKSNQCVEVRMGFNNSLVSEVNEKNSYGYEGQQLLNNVEELLQKEFEAYNERYFTIQTILLITTPLLMILVAYIWYCAYKKYDKERVSTFDSEYYRELPATYPPAELGYLYNFKDTTKDDLGATIMDLVRKGYITIDTNGESTLEKNPNYIYRYNRNKNQSNLKSYEKFVLEWYFSHITQVDSLSLKAIEEYLKKEENAQQYLKDNKKLVELVRVEARKNNFFDDLRSVWVNYWYMFPIILLFMMITLWVQVVNYYTYAMIFSTIALCLLILLGSYLATIKRRSEKGNEDYVRWEAFKNFLLNFGKFEDYTMPLIEIWEHYLVYAVSFGIADKVEEQMNLKFKSLGEDNYYEYVNSSTFVRTRYYCYVGRSCASSSTLAQSTIAQAQAARSSGGSGGSFGGGRSFGGGGGGHGGR